MYVRTYEYVSHSLTYSANFITAVLQLGTPLAIVLATGTETETETGTGTGAGTDQFQSVDSQFRDGKLM